MYLFIFVVVAAAACWLAGATQKEALVFAFTHFISSHISLLNLSNKE